MSVSCTKQCWHQILNGPNHPTGLKDSLGHTHGESPRFSKAMKVGAEVPCDALLIAVHF